MVEEKSRKRRGMFRLMIAKRWGGCRRYYFFFSLDLTRDVRRVICRWFIFYEIISRGKKR